MTRELSLTPTTTLLHAPEMLPAYLVTRKHEEFRI